MEGHFNLLDAFLTLDGFKNFKVMVIKTKFDFNDYPQQLFEIGMKFKELIKFLLTFLKTYE